MLFVARQAFRDLLPAIENGLNAAVSGEMKVENSLEELNNYWKIYQTLRDRYHLDSFTSMYNKFPSLSWQLINSAVIIYKGDAYPMPTSTTDPSPTSTTRSETTTQVTRPTSTGDLPTMSTTPTKTSKYLPIRTATSPSGPVYCFSQHNDDSYVSFNATGVKAAMDTLCYTGNSLNPGGSPYTYVHSNPFETNVIASVQWAVDQSGCKPQKRFEMEILVTNYNSGSRTENYGVLHAVRMGPVAQVPTSVLYLDMSQDATTTLYPPQAPMSNAKIFGGMLNTIQTTTLTPAATTVRPLGTLVTSFTKKNLL
ncbi:hypothetical protein BDV29DRAFT_156986 [Aspergillus leporis]|uniref:Uncharacterized protein n=1 Tax=Aspergillus leporis TaxID=41062 RepID=A0A5N5X1Z0_9EURO|nr:hypothetical protein BDV29DRAFT_156986 [Aspergillus leporis]